jgi:rubrerythrin
VLDEKTAQRVEWRVRLLAQIISGRHGRETVDEMLTAGLRQAHAEGLEDAAEILERVSAGSRGAEVKRITGIMAEMIRDHARRCLMEEKT